MAVSLDRKSRVTFGSAKRWLGRLEVVVGAFLAFYILVVTNIIAFRHPVRIDLTQEELHTLSQETRQRLKLVGEEIKVVIPTFLQAENPRHQAEREVLQRARLLLDEYIAIQPLIKITGEVDVIGRPERWVALRKDYDLTDAQVNRILFFAGKSNEFRQTLTPQDLAAFGTVADPLLEVPEVKEFRGERALTGAILRLVERQRRPVYFTQDKQELSLRPAGGRARMTAREGLNDLRHEIETAGYEARELEIARVNEIPADCELLVIAGPFQAYKDEELRVLEKYLERGGRLFAALDPPVTGLENLLKDYGVEVKRGTLQVRGFSELSWGGAFRIPIRTFSGQHPITRVFQHAAGFAMELENARALSPCGAEKRWEASQLLAARAEPGGTTYVLVGERSRDDVLEKDDEFTVAVAVKDREYERPPPNWQPKGARLVVVGAASFLADGKFRDHSHRDFFMNSVAWLTGREERASVGGQEWVKRTLAMDAPFRSYLRWVPTLLLPAIFLCLGAFVYYLRRV